MAGVARTNMDSAGGVLIGGSTSVFVNGQPVARIGTSVSGHGDSPHDSSIMVTASSTVFVEGLPVCREGDVSSCGHVSTGSSNVKAG